MNRFLVMIEHPDYRGEVELLGKLGSPESSPQYLILKTEEDIDTVRKCKGVMLVELDEQAEHESVENIGWALPWISNTEDSYHNENTGYGVDIYVVDTGVRDTHNELAGRVRTLYAYDGLPYATTGPVSPEHGTAVAGCAAGTDYGTAPEAMIVNCRIDFMTSTILKALDRILRDHLDKPDDRPSIVNFSGSTLSPIVGKLFERLTQYGIVVVAASGNDSEPEPRYPAKNIWCLAIGAINKQNEPAWFTNKECDVYVPGQDILTASVFADDAPITISGTSFSAPYYAGLLACLLEGSDKFNTSSLVSTFNHQMINQIMEKDRLPNFRVERNMSVRTATTKGLSGKYYKSKLHDVTDSQIKEWLLANAADPLTVVKLIKDFNLSFSRLCRSAAPEFTPEQLNEYFKDAGVKPWWYTGV